MVMFLEAILTWCWAIVTGQTELAVVFTLSSRFVVEGSVCAGKLCCELRSERTEMTLRTLCNVCRSLLAEVTGRTGQAVALKGQGVVGTRGAVNWGACTSWAACTLKTKRNLA